jgi:hypothetical protein
MKKTHQSKGFSLLAWGLGLLGLGTLSTAYIDPGSGSFLIQVLVATVLGAGLLIRAFWSQISAFFGRKPKAADDTVDTDDAQ